MLRDFSDALVEERSGEDLSLQRRKRQKVLFLVSSLDVGGIETYLLKFIRFAGEDIDATVLCKSGRAGALEGDFREAGASIVLLALGTSISRRYFDFLWLVARNRFDSVCDFTGDFGGLPLFVAMLTGVKRRIAFYRGSQHQFRRTLFRLIFVSYLAWLVRFCATRILANSEIAIEQFHPNRDRLDSRFKVIRNPAPTPEPLELSERIELRTAAGIPPEAIVITHVGRVAPAKNHSTILRILERTLARHPDTWGILIGQGTSKLIADLPQTEVFDRLRAFEHRSDILDFLQASDVFLFPSLNEGMPNALVEAMAVGCPIVASDIPSIREVFPPGYAEHLFYPTDVDAGVQRIEALLSVPDCCYGSRLASWARTEFSTDRTFGAFLLELGVAANRLEARV